MSDTLDQLGYDPTSVMGKFDRGFERAMAVMQDGTETLIETAKKNPIGSAAVGAQEISDL